jgi:hypothetical protein
MRLVISLSQALLQKVVISNDITEEYRMSDHKDHMCEFSRHHGVKEMRERVKDPKFICEVCGRAANKEEYLCRPVKL